MKHNKRLLSILLAVMMVLGLAATAHADGDQKTTKVQITKTLKIGQGITVPNETFTFTFADVTPEEAAELGETGSYIVPGATQAGSVDYPDLPDVTIQYDSDVRTAAGTDEELTLISGPLDFKDAGNGWDFATPGLYIYSVKEKLGSTEGMEYDTQKYFLKVYVKNTGVDFVAVYKQNEDTSSPNKWVKVNGAPNDAKETTNTIDGAEDYDGNEFRFTNTYRKLVTEHPRNLASGDTDADNDGKSSYAFKLTKDVAGSFASQSYNFDFNLSITLPDSYKDFGKATVRVNGYTANLLTNTTNFNNDDTVATIQLPVESINVVYLHHNDSLIIEQLPAGTKIQVTEVASGMKYLPTYSGKWGAGAAALPSPYTKTADNAGDSLATETFVVGEDGAYVQFTNTLRDKDVTATGIVISNLPYILMVGIALTGIGFLTLSKKRHSR